VIIKHDWKTHDLIGVKANLRNRNPNLHRPVGLSWERIML